MKQERIIVLDMLSIKFFYFSLVILIWVVEIIMTYQTRNLYYPEDGFQNALAVIWFIHKEISTIASTAFGWYALLHGIYSLFGFSLNTAHYLRMILQLFTLLSLAILLKRYFGYKKSLIPLLTIGLSPTFSYFITYSSLYGSELQFLPICLLILDSLNLKHSIRTVILEAVAWFVAMFGVLSYATFNFFLPALAIIHFYKLRLLLSKKNRQEIIIHVTISTLAFLTPLIIGLLYFKDRASLFYDPTTDGLGGLFRSGSILYFDTGVFTFAITHTFNDLFNNGYSYYYQLKNGEFSYLLPALTIILVILLSLQIPKKYFFFKLIIWITVIFNEFIANFSVDLSGLPGVRRHTPTLVSFYALFSLIWYLTLSNHFTQFRKYFIIGILLVLPLHHLLVLPNNFQHLTDLPEYWSYDKRYLSFDSPNDYFKSKLDILTKEDLKLDCREAYHPPLEACSYQLIFATLEANCLYNKLTCHNIYAFDPIGNEFVPLTVETLDGNYLRLR